MAKPSKLPPKNASIPITAYFARKPSTSVKGTSIRLSTSSGVATSFPNASTDLSDGNHKPRGTVMEVEEVLSPNINGGNVKSSKRKSAHSLAGQRQCKSQLDAIEQHVHATTDVSTGVHLDRKKVTLCEKSVASRKKARRSPSDSSMVTPNDLVLSSQSDETELTTPKSVSCNPDSIRVRESDDYWPGITFIPTPDGSYEDSQLDGLGMSHFVGEKLSNSRDKQESIVAPPISDHSVTNRFPTPVATDGQAKIAERIAEIKANAYAQVAASTNDDSEINVFKDVLDDSSDEDTLPAITVDYKMQRQSETSIEQPGRYALRSYTSSTSRSKSDTIPKISKRNTLPAAKQPNLAASHGKRRGLDSNPIDLLLKEKKIAEKKGKGEASFRLAEQATDKAVGKDSLFHEMEDEEIMDWTEEGKGILYGDDWLPSSFSGSKSGKMDDLLVEADNQNLLGEQRGKVVIGILKSEREKEIESIREAERVGVPFWTTADDHQLNRMDVDPAAPSFDYNGKHTVLNKLKSALAGNNVSLASLILDTGVIVTSKAYSESELVPFLFQLALSPNQTPLSYSAFRTLSHLWSQQDLSTSFSLFSPTLRMLSFLGADPSVIASMGWPSLGTCATGLIPRVRNTILQRMIILLGACANRIVKEDIPDIILALLLIGIDSSTPLVLQQVIKMTVNTICLSIGPRDDVCKEEPIICSKIIECAVAYPPVNKALLISFLSVGSGRTRRMASFIAHSIISNRESLVPVDYSVTPPLSELLEQLTSTQPDYLKAHFILDADTDYADLGHFVFILGVALADLREYVTQEQHNMNRRGSYFQHLESPSQSIYEKAETELQLIKIALKYLHDKITDTRGVHLDRSRTKGALKGLEMRIHYQRSVLLNGESGMKKPRKNLHQYFNPKG